MGDAAQESGRVFRLIYRSRNLIPPDRRKAELGTLFSAARSSNKKQDITGALLVHGDWFAQVLEGSETPVRALYERIQQDGRHDKVSILAEGPAERVFGRWSMARVSAEGEPDIPLIAHRDGISPAASRGTTPDQEAVLDTLRQATRDDAHAV
ncbi:MAG: BLUF domain-containing protein [Actinobacteria bacterium]|nr:BLUF domain-containing protein [Actinomycetota bacterium]